MFSDDHPGWSDIANLTVFFLSLTPELFSLSSFLMPFSYSFYDFGVMTISSLLEKKVNFQ